MSSENHSSDNPGYEKQDVSMLAIWAWTIGLTVFTIVCIFGVDSYFVWSKERVRIQQANYERVERNQFEAAAQEQLTTYGVVDATKGVYRIPISEAMKKIVAESN